MFDSILIANRGEIACRIIRTARRWASRTVAVYSEADAAALHVALADEAFGIGPAPARDSYLKIERDHRRRARARAPRRSIPATASWPRTPAFAEACAGGRPGLHRPAADAIRAMGSKSAAKALMERRGRAGGAGLSWRRPGRRACLRTRRHAIGYPVLIKASAGGGGKGMRVVAEPGEFAAALAAGAARGASGVRRRPVLLEKLPDPAAPHRDAGVRATRHGNVVHLFERDCSIQRRHQKVIEEAPAPGLDARHARAHGRGRGRRRARDRLRRRRHGRVHRRGRGRLLLHGDEHAPAGRASGDRDDHRPRSRRMAAARRRRASRCRCARTSSPSPAMRSRRASMPRTRRAISCRRPARCAICARPPRSRACARGHAACAQGDAISVHYDPMIAKLIAHGSGPRGRAPASRARARRLRDRGRADQSSRCCGRSAAHPAFRAGAVDTGFIATTPPR